MNVKSEIWMCFSNLLSYYWTCNMQQLVSVIQVRNFTATPHPNLSVKKLFFDVASLIKKKKKKWKEIRSSLKKFVFCFQYQVQRHRLHLISRHHHQLISGGREFVIVSLLIDQISMKVLENLLQYSIIWSVIKSPIWY